jgi:hypothetical protein
MHYRRIAFHKNTSASAQKTLNNLFKMLLGALAIILYALQLQAAPFCPLCVVAAFSAIFGGAKQGMAPVGTALSVPFALAFIDGIRPRNMTFQYPQENQTFQSGKEYDLFMNTFGLVSVFRARTADLYLLDASFNKVAKVASEGEFEVINNVTFKAGTPQKGFGHMKWTVPELVTGRYFLKYVSGWTLWYLIVM